MKKIAIGWSVAGAALACGLSLGAADYSRMTVDLSALPPEKAFLGDIVLRRAQDRTVFSEKAGTLAVAFRLDASLKGDDAAVTVRDGRAVVRAGRVRGLVFGAGELMRLNLSEPVPGLYRNRSAHGAVRSWVD